MVLDPKAVRDDRDRRGGDLYTLKEGITMLYLCPPCREIDRVNYVEAGVHYGLRRGATLCLDPTRNRIFKNPNFQEIMKAEGVRLPARCDVCGHVDALFRKAKTEDDKKEPRRLKF